jgi:small subunit ribosomal protein S20
MSTRKSAQKFLRNSEKARIRNKARKTELKTLEKKLRAIAAEKKTDEIQAVLNLAVKRLDKAVKSGTIPKSRANRKKSQFMKLANSI